MVFHSLFFRLSPRVSACHAYCVLLEVYYAQLVQDTTLSTGVLEHSSVYTSKNINLGLSP
jgi:hypothetical protein